MAIPILKEGNMKMERLLLTLAAGSPLWIFVFGIVYVLTWA